MAQHMAYGEAGEFSNRTILVAVHTSEPPSEAEWNGWVALLERCGRAVEQDLWRLPNLVVTDGGAPSTAQRTAVNVLIAQAKTMPPVAVVTDSILVRTLLRGFSIFNPRMRGFAPADFAAAIAHLGLPASEAPSLIQACRRLARELSPSSVKTADALKA